MEWNWWRVGLIAFGAVAGIGGGWVALADDAPRWVTAWAALLLIGGIFCAAAIGLLAWIWLTEYVRPRFIARPPAQPLMLATELGALVGTRRFSTHPVRFWLGLTLNDRAFVGVMIFHPAEEMTVAYSEHPND